MTKVNWQLTSRQRDLWQAVVAPDPQAILWGMSFRATGPSPGAYSACHLKPTLLPE
jgi:hypothetical protein